MRWICVLAVVLSASFAMAQDAPQPDQLKKMYDAVLGQLQQAQNRKNELAAENDKLNARVLDLQKQLDAAKTKNEELTRETASFAKRTFFLRSQYACWQEFIRQYPKLEARWNVFLQGDLLTPAELPNLIDKDWPLGRNDE